MNKTRLSDFIYTLDLDHESGMYGVYNFKRFYTREEAFTYAESLAMNNPDIAVTITIAPRFRKPNVLKTS